MSDVQLDDFSRNLRRDAIASHSQQIGLDYIEVATNPLRLLLHFVPDLSEEGNKKVIAQNIAPANIHITNGLRVTNTNLQIKEVTQGGFLLGIDFGSPGNALSFDGVDDYLKIPASPSLNNLAKATWEIWFKPKSQNGEKKVVWREFPGGVQTIWEKGTISVGAYVGGGWQVASASGYSAEQWYHVAGVIDGSTLCLFINGELKHSVSCGNLETGNKDLHLARWNAPGYDFQGEIDEVRIWNIARSSEQIQANIHHQLVGNEPGLVGYWKFEEGSGQIASDSSAGKNHGTLYGSTWIKSTAPIGNELLISDLEQGNLSENLRQLLIENNILLSQAASVSKQGSDWLITDLSNANSFVIKRTENGKLNLYDTKAIANNILLVKLLRLQDRQQDASASGNFPVYTLELVNVPNLDPFFSKATFSLDVDSSSRFDPLRSPPSLPEPPPALEINYLARDYSSFRQLMLDRLSVVMPQWKERHPADLGITLVEILAYAGDRLSYYQDAVATEAYLGTARQRISIGRHARLIDYTMHEGCNARVWVQIQIKNDVPKEGLSLPKSTQLLTKSIGSSLGVYLTCADYEQVLRQHPQVFETIYRVTLFPEHNQIYFYTWGAREFSLPQGATSATLQGDFPNLKAGDVLIFEEVLSPTTGNAEDANPKHRHAVRLTQVTPQQDTLFDRPITEIEWHSEDALPFPLSIAIHQGTQSLQNISIALGNIVLAEHGRRIEAETLPPVPETGRYRPQLQNTGLTHAIPYDAVRGREESASKTLTQDPHAAVPMIELKVKRSGQESVKWWARPDLLNSDRFAHDFVVEMESDGSAHLRFGDGVRGKKPASTVSLYSLHPPLAQGGQDMQQGHNQLVAEYRVGNGVQGNIGYDAIAHAHIVCDRDRDIGNHIINVRNPLPAQGGTEPESIEQVRLYAPEVFHTQQQRCVTASDYQTVLERHPQVQKAAVSIRWTGSWYTVFMAVKRQENRPIDQTFKETLLQFMERYRLAGYDLEITAPRFVPIDIALTVQVAQGYFASSVKRMLLETFSNVDLPNGKRGFFHPDNFTFGQPVYMSQIVKTAMELPGIARIEMPIKQFQRWGSPPQDEIKAGKITIAPLEIARLDNNLDAPENGRIEFNLEGGL